MARSARRSGRILVGTTSWTENTSLEKGRFYPAEVKSPEERLQYYSTVFPIVEVDSTFYALPSGRDAALWVERADPGFAFDVKAYRLFAQHRAPLRSLPTDLREGIDADDGSVQYDKLPDAIRRELWQRFRAALEPLRARGRLGIVLFQFSPSMICNESGFDHIAHCAEQMSGFQIGVELRDASWLSEKQREHTSRFLRARRVTQVVTDESQGRRSSVPAVWTATADVAVLRLHGRQRRSPKKRVLPSAQQRVAYRYTDEELKSFLQPVMQLAQQARDVHVLFNNCYSDWAHRNAARFMELLGKRAVTMRSARMIHAADNCPQPT